MNYIFIVNPLAGNGQAEAQIRSALEGIAERGRCEIYVTKGPGDARTYVKQWCAGHPGEEVRFIACGGDGTMNEVCSGAVGQDYVSVTCYPCGSGNDFVKSFGGAEKFLNIPALLRAPVRKLDLLKAGDHYSDNVINFGFDTTVAMTVNEARAKKGTSGKNAYTKGVVKALLTAMNNRFQVIADGEELVPGSRALLCTLGNGKYVGGSFCCAPRALTDDGYMEVCIIKPISRLRFVRILDTYTRGGHLDDEKMRDIVIYRRAKKVEVQAPAGFAYSLDGEIIHENRFTVEVIPGALDLAVPEQ